MSNNRILESLHPLERKVWPFLKENITAKDLERLSKLKDVEVVRALQWLEAKGIIKINMQGREIVSLTNLGKEYSVKGLPEKKFLESLKGITPSSKIPLSNQELGVCIGLLKRNNAIKLVPGKELSFEITDIGREMLEGKWPFESLLKKLPAPLGLLSKEEKELFLQLKSRGIATSDMEKGMSVSLTELGKSLQNVKFSGKDIIDVLTPKMLADNSWKGKDFRRYDLKFDVPKIYAGRLHPLQETISQIRKIFLNMGFKEMEGPLIETAFWCMDSMWIPQDHPAREVQDTFYLPYKGTIPKELARKVAEMHETGGQCGSKGYGYKWNEDLAKQLLLRTHTTATTFRFFGEKKPKFPAKYFYIGRIFRNEAIDATHLPEFHQSEGFIMDEDLTLRDLMGYIKEFYNLMGIHKIKFRPAYNPYTEPSMECIGYNEQLGKWVELINSGIFRPEALEPYGINVPVIAWGLGVERLAMMLSQQKDIRNMLGASGDLNWFRNSKMVKKW